MGKFVIRRVETGIKFDLCADNGETVAVSEVYSGRAGCLRGIESVRACARLGRIADLTLNDENRPTNPRFEIFRDRRGDHRFRLRSRNGKVIACSEPYKSKSACISGVECILAIAPDAAIKEDLSNPAG